MEGSKLLDYIILALIFAIIINVFIQLFGGKCGKGTESMASAENVLANNLCPPPIQNVSLAQPVPVDALSIGAPLIEADNNSNYSANDLVKLSESLPPSATALAESIAVKSSEAVDKIIKLRSNNEQLSSTQSSSTQSNSVACPLQGTAYANDRYIREFVLGGKYNCVDEVKPKEFSRVEIMRCHDNMLNFNDKINASSSNGVDTVDKLNELYTGGNSEMIGCQGKTISDVFNGLTQSMIDKKKKCVNPNCLIPPSYDMATRTAVYTGNAANGQFIRNGLRYEDDEVSNGNPFYDNIEATDNDFEDNLMWA